MSEQFVHERSSNMHLALPMNNHSGKCCTVRCVRRIGLATQPETTTVRLLRESQRRSGQIFTSSIHPDTNSALVEKFLLIPVPLNVALKDCSPLGSFARNELTPAEPIPVQPAK